MCVRGLTLRAKGVPVLERTGKKMKEGGREERVVKKEEEVKGARGRCCSPTSTQMELICAFDC